MNRGPGRGRSAAEGGISWEGGQARSSVDEHEFVQVEEQTAGGGETVLGGIVDELAALGFSGWALEREAANFSAAWLFEAFIR